MQFHTASRKFEKRSIKKSINQLDVAFKFLCTYTSKSVSKAFDVLFRPSPALFCRIKAIECVFRLLITKEMNKNRVQNAWRYNLFDMQYEDEN